MKKFSTLIRYHYGFLLSLSLFFYCKDLEAAPSSLGKCLTNLRDLGVLQIKVGNEDVYWVVLRKQKLKGIQKHISLEVPYRFNKASSEFEAEIDLQKIITAKHSPNSKYVIAIDEKHQLWCWYIPWFSPDTLHQRSETYGKLLWFQKLSKPWNITEISFKDAENAPESIIEIRMKDPETGKTLVEKYSLPHYSPPR